MKLLCNLCLPLFLGMMGILPLAVFAAENTPSKNQEGAAKMKAMSTPINVPYGIHQNADDTDIYDVPLDSDPEEEEELQKMTAPKKK